MPLLLEQGEFGAEEFAAVGGAKAIEQQLADVGEGDAIAARNALEGDLLQEIAEEAIDGGRVGEVCGRGEQFGRGGFGIALPVNGAMGVEGAKPFDFNARRRSAIGGEVRRAGEDWHAAAMTASIGIAAQTSFGDGCGLGGRVWHGKCAVGSLPCGFFKTM